MLRNTYRHKGLILALFVLFSCFFEMVVYAQSEAQNTPSSPIFDSQFSAPLPSALVSQVDDSYRVGPDDEIMVRVFGEADLTGAYTVGTNGTMALPLVGDVPVNGLSLKEIQSKLITLLKDGYLLDPQVTVEIKKYRPFYILGEVKVPGSYSYVSNMSILNAVAVAGGFTYRANKRSVEIKRTHNDTTEIIKSEAVDSLVVPGDIIIIKERFF